MSSTEEIQALKVRRQKIIDRLEIVRAAVLEERELQLKLAAYNAVLEDLEPAQTNGHGTPSLLAEPSEQAPEPEEGPTTEYSNLQEMTRGEAIKWVLRKHPGISPATIVGFLEAGGRRNDNTHKVSNELNRLQGNKIARRRGTGRWFLVDPG